MNKEVLYNYLLTPSLNFNDTTQIYFRQRIEYYNADTGEHITHPSQVKDSHWETHNSTFG